MRIAITGKMGSGKSEVLKILARKGYYTLSADLVYADLLACDESFVSEISNAVGVEPLRENGKLLLNRKAISQKVFSDGELLKKLNSVAHPKIMQKILKMSDEKSLSFCEIPLLSAVPEYEKYFDRVIVVIRDNEQRIKGVEQRDDLDREQIQKRLDFQKDYIINSQKEHTFIYNDGDLSALEKKVETLEKTF